MEVEFFNQLFVPQEAIGGQKVDVRSDFEIISDEIDFFFTLVRQNKYTSLKMIEPHGF